MTTMKDTAAEAMPASDEQLARLLVQRAGDAGTSLLGSGGLLQKLTKLGHRDSPVVVVVAEIHAAEALCLAARAAGGQEVDLGGTPATGPVQQRVGRATMPWAQDALA